MNNILYVSVALGHTTAAVVTIVGCRGSGTPEHHRVTSTLISAPVLHKKNPSKIVLFVDQTEIQLSKLECPLLLFWTYETGVRVFS